jgi:hypothetical protein
METAAPTVPSLFEIIRFIVEVGLLGGIGGAIGFLWKAINDWRKHLLEERKLLLEEYKAQQGFLHQQWERLYAELKPAMENLANIAIRVADEHYRPVLDAICRVDLYADTYEIVDQCIAAAKEFIETGKTPKDIPKIVRDALDSYPDTKEFLKAMEEARPSGADYMWPHLEAFYQATEKLINSGYMWELEERAGRENLIRFFNCYNAADLPTLIKSRSPDELSKFLKEWKSQQLEPLRKLRDEVPWHEFLSHYYRKLRTALKSDD